MKSSKTGKADAKSAKGRSRPLNKNSKTVSENIKTGPASPVGQPEEKRYPFGSFIIIGALLLAAAFFVFSEMFAKGGQDQRTVISGLPSDIKEKADQAQKTEVFLQKIIPVQENPPSNTSTYEKSAGMENLPLPAKEVTIDFLYADWCGYCSKMKPIVAKISSEMPPERFEVRYLNEKEKSTNATVMGIYDLYRQKGYFKGYPSLVANGNSSKIGLQSERDFRAWVCSHFSSPLPEACGQ